ncbi:hypothetical protein DPEC_G00123190 [Dallia pectoralis]|uniref:Uncharacterized protein n=1 Tax=Dallia pectoralis TaxID=75939 RepID=A0ACC2GQK8_DALPE|nr:hypothetical protein DPEC_G00123190 [Dallia pectoralis]
MNHLRSPQGSPTGGGSGWVRRVGRVVESRIRAVFLTVSHWELEAILESDGALKPECDTWAVCHRATGTYTYVTHDRSTVEAVALEVRTWMTVWMRGTWRNSITSLTQ